MIIPWLLDPHLFDSAYLSRDNEALEEMLDLYETFTLWPLSEKIRLLIYQQLDSLIATTDEGPIVARAQSLKSMLSLYIKNHGVMVSDAELIEKNADQFNLQLLQNIPSIEALVTYADREDSLRNCCPDPFKNNVCNLEKRRDSSLQLRYRKLAEGALVNPDSATLNNELSPFCYWASKLTVIDRYMAKSFIDYRDGPNERNRINWKNCRNAILAIYELWNEGAKYVDKVAFNLIAMYEPADRNARHQPHYFKAAEAQEIVDEMVLDLGLSGKNFSLSIKEFKNPNIVHDRYLVLEDNTLAIGMSSGLANLRPDGAGTVDLYRRKSYKEDDKINKILAKTSLAEIYGHKINAHLNSSATSQIEEKLRSSGLRALDRAFE